MFNPNPPIHVVDTENIRASIFKRSYRDSQGEKHNTFAISFGRRYQKDGLWKTSSTLDPHQVRIAIAVLQQAEALLMKNRALPSDPISGSEASREFREQEMQDKCRMDMLCDVKKEALGE
ncbi:MAG: hypothetical protein AB1656_13545 [Candidatus Omnitrophota bacterium]